MTEQKTYVPAPEVPQEVEPRYRAILGVLSGRTNVTEAAREAGLSRHRFQTVMHRGMQALIAAISPQPAGRPAKPEREAALEAENARLREENAGMAERLESTERLMGAVGQFLRGKSRPRRPRGPKTPNDDADEALSRARELRALGLDANLSAAAIGRHAATVRRWAARQRAGRPLCQRRGPGPHAPPSQECVEAAEQRVRVLRGCIGAEALRHAVPGISRRDAAAIKCRTLLELDRERREQAVHVTIAQPGLLRGFDAMEAKTTDGKRYLLVAGDGCVPYRTRVDVVPRYDAASVRRHLERDFDAHGAPLVLRADRAKAHDTAEVRAVLDAHEVLLLHGPPRHPGFYGQLERQNREHRQWLKALGAVGAAELEAEVAQMTAGLNELKPRSTLDWKSPGQVWAGRRELHEDRKALREEVAETTARLQRCAEARGWAAGTAERLAIERTLINKGYLSLEWGGWCYQNSSPIEVH